MEVLKIRESHRTKFRGHVTDLKHRRVAQEAGWLMEIPSTHDENQGYESSRGTIGTLGPA